MDFTSLDRIIHSVCSSS